ncbi:ATP-binding protein [Streptomyces flavofungini]|uniref:ATP-binding protein n=1 Tax=Streptomyces flavofungini TaxID=68200 RepID=A0ABS0XJ75_9ACTN|nr:ATP-binding protein [Streptomyces flavofungini]MBJ3813279.1 ATP-binding protein [Streptomyces flavofungini]GHC90949.1 hypothetical protein GCM10010349_79300 [Streptomyces flavofungini]
MTTTIAAPAAPQHRTHSGIRASLTVPLSATPAAAKCARQAIIAFLAGARRKELTDDACTVATELVNNAVEHAGGPIQLRLRLHGQLLCIACRDGDSARWPRISGDLDAWEEHGRGLAMIAVLARGWRARLAPGGKDVIAWL